MRYVLVVLRSFRALESAFKRHEYSHARQTAIERERFERWRREKIESDLDEPLIGD